MEAKSKIENRKLKISPIAPNATPLAIGLTPAFQRTLQFGSLRTGEVNRTVDIVTSAAGKGVNVARVLKQLDCPARLLAFLGGFTGRAIEEELGGLGITCIRVDVAASTRICQTLIDRAHHEVTELVEESMLPAPAEWDQLYARYHEALDQTSMVVISGTLMPGAQEDVYAELAQQAQQRDIPVVIDSHLTPLLKVLPHQPLVVKMNIHELGLTTGRALKNDADVHDAVCMLLDQGAQHALITSGAKTSWLVGPTGATGFIPPRIKPLNPIGSGDSVTAGLVAGLLAGQSIEDAVDQGIQCGTANAMTSIPAQLDLHQLATLHVQRITG